MKKFYLVCLLLSSASCSMNNSATPIDADAPSARQQSTHAFPCDADTRRKGVCQ